MSETAKGRTERLGDTLRRLVRRDAKSHIANILAKLRPGDVSEALRSLTPESRFGVFNVLRDRFPDTVGDVLTELEPAQRSELLQRLEPEEIGSILRRVPVDDAVFLVDSLPEDLKVPVLEIVDLRKDLDDVQNHLSYQDETAGRLMDPGYFALEQSTTVKEAVAAIQQQDDVEMIFYLYIVDEDGRLVGVTSLRQLLLAAPETTLAQVMQRDVIRVDTSTDQEEVAELAARYDLLAVPVTELDRLVGIVTVDDIVDVFQDEATEDFYKMVGTSDNELLYEEKALRVAGIRLPWLLFNLVALLGSGLLLERLQSRFGEALFLLIFAPVVMGMGGNTGSQTSTITVRGLATGRLGIGPGRVGRFLFHQAKVGALLGLVTGVVAGLAAVGLEKNPWYGLVVGLALFLALTFSSCSGAAIPLIFDRFGIDPAVASAPLVTTANDITGILIYFGLAALLIQQLLA